MNNRSYYPALDGLRGVAILMVVFLHNFGFMNYFFFGWLGVDLFFVLSGFLITDILLKTLDKPHFLRNFYMRRVLRIFPLYYLILIICFFILPYVPGQPEDLSYYQGNQFWFWTYLQNWYFVFHPPVGSKMLLHTWSLAVEEQFYIVWPATILLIRRPKILLAVVIVVLAAVGIARYEIWAHQVEDLAYASLYTFTRIDGICIGCMLALIMQINPLFLKRYTTAIVLLMASVNFAFYFFNDRHSFTLPYLAFVGYTTFAVLFGLLTYEAVMGQSRIIQFLFNNRILKFFGRISYGLYVYHWPVYILSFDAIRIALMKNSLSQRVSEMSAALAATGLCIIVSLLSYHYFEKRFLKFKKKFS